MTAIDKAEYEARQAALFKLHGARDPLELPSTKLADFTMGDESVFELCLAADGLHWRDHGGRLVALDPQDGSGLTHCCPVTGRLRTDCPPILPIDCDPASMARHAEQLRNMLLRTVCGQYAAMGLEPPPEALQVADQVWHMDVDLVAREPA